MLHLTDDDFLTEAVEFDGPVVIDFYATWCAPCRIFSPIFDKLSLSNTGIKFAKVNVEDAQDTTRRFKIDAIPKIILMNKGKTIRSWTGVPDTKDFQTALDAVKV